ncbi:MAG: TlyA family RNA methyltransferase [Candidatus Saccharimonadales bacterium]
MKRLRLDQAIVLKKLASSRRQAASYIKLGQVIVGKKVITEAGAIINDNDVVTLNAREQYVSRAALKLASVADKLSLNFANKTVLDVGSSTGGFTDYALKHGAQKIIAVEAGTNQFHSSLLGHPKIELHEKTDIRNFKTKEHLDVVLIDVSFISVREILPYVTTLSSPDTEIVVMVKPQFETSDPNFLHKGVIKNDHVRRDVLKDFETWSRVRFIIINKSDSAVTGTKGNLERFYLIKPKLTQ